MFQQDGIEVVSPFDHGLRVNLRCNQFPDVVVTYQFNPETKKVFVFGSVGRSQVTSHWKNRMHKKAAAILHKRLLPPRRSGK